MTSNTLTDREALYCLCHVPGFGGVTIRGLKDTFGTCLSAWTASPQELRKSGVLTERRAEVFLESRKYESVWRKEFAGLAQKNIRVIAECDPDYPTRFLPYKDRPAALFVKGSLPENEVPSVAIVGARACTEYRQASTPGNSPTPESTSSAAWQPAWTAMPTEAPSSVESPPTQSWAAG